jgi:hypothetical protein
MVSPLMVLVLALALGTAAADDGWSYGRATHYGKLGDRKKSCFNYPCSARSHRNASIACAACVLIELTLQATRGRSTPAAVATATWTQRSAPAGTSQPWQASSITGSSSDLSVSVLLLLLLLLLLTALLLCRCRPQLPGILRPVLRDRVQPHIVQGQLRRVHRPGLGLLRLLRLRGGHDHRHLPLPLPKQLPLQLPLVRHLPGNACSLALGRDLTMTMQPKRVIAHL